MKEEWKVFIKGVEGRGNEVIGTLVNLGAKNNLVGGLGNNPGSIYFIKHDGYIGFVGAGSEYAKIMEDYYTEIKLSEKLSEMWNDGDILFSPQYNRFAIYAYEIPVPYLVVAYYCFDENFLTHSFPRIKINDFRLATPKEIVQFHELLHKHGKDWDAKKMKLVNWRWKPRKNEVYWIVTTILDVNFFIWREGPTDMQMFDCGNCFRTKEEAIIMSKKIKHLLKGE